MKTRRFTTSVGRTAGRSGLAVVTLSAALFMAMAISPAAQTPTLGEALDAPELSWTAVGWYPDTWLTHDGVDAANCEHVPIAGAGLETVVSGPGVVSFWWANMLCPCQGLTFHFAVGGVEQAAYPSYWPEPWQYVCAEVPSGPQTLSWVLLGGGVLAENPFAAVDQVSFGPMTAPAIVQEPQDVTVGGGDQAALSVNAEGQFLRYQWSKDGQPILGASNATCVISRACRADAGLYSVVVSNLVGTATSRAAQITVLPRLAGPVLSNGVLHVFVTALPPACTVVISASTDLTHWGPVQTNEVSTGDTFLAVPVEVAAPARFLRAQVW